MSDKIADKIKLPNLVQKIVKVKAFLVKQPVNCKLNNAPLLIYLALLPN